MQGQGGEKGRGVKNIGRQRARNGWRPEGTRPEVKRDRKRQVKDPGHGHLDTSTEERDKKAERPRVERILS